MEKNIQIELITKDALTNTTNSLKIANELIIAKYKLKLLQLKMWFAILSTLKEKDNTFYRYKFKTKDLATFVGISLGKGYTKMVLDILDDLQSEKIQIIKRRDSDFDKSQFIKARILSSIEYFGNGEVEVIIDPKLHEYFFELKNNFTYLEIKEITDFNSIWAIRIYQIIKQYINIGTRPILIDDFKSILMLDDKYNSFADIRRFVIEPAIKIINQKSSLNVSYSSNGGRGKKTTQITFFGEYKNKINDEIIQLSDKQKENYNLLRSHKINKSIALKIVQKYDSTLIKENINYAVTCKRKNLSGFIVKAIEDDYYSINRENKEENTHNIDENKKRILNEYNKAKKANDTYLMDIWKETCIRNNINVS